MKKETFTIRRPHNNLSEWSRGTVTTATRCVTFSDTRNVDDGTIPAHVTSPPPYHHQYPGPGAGAIRYQGNFYQNPMDQEFVKITRHSAAMPVPVPQTSYTLDRVGPLDAVDQKKQISIRIFRETSTIY